MPLESRAHALEVANALKEIAGRLKIGLVYKTSFDKANRSRDRLRAALAWRRPSDFCGDSLVARISVFTTCMSPRNARKPHKRSTCCRSRHSVPTDGSAAGGRSDRQGRQRQEGPVPRAVDMANVVSKITGGGNPNVLVTERGASFGYNTLVSDMRALPIMAQRTGAPSFSTPPIR